MDVVYVGGMAIFAVLTFALIAGCERLTRVRQLTSHGVPAPTATAVATSMPGSDQGLSQGERS
jgi:hypothetical protein